MPVEGAVVGEDVFLVDGVGQGVAVLIEAV
jgi:hypothetical protein